jgi:hypothetical protein
MKNGRITELEITSTAGGPLQVKLPFKTFSFLGMQKNYELLDGVLKIKTSKGETIRVKNEAD